jgi:hypothetical protein
MSKNQHKEENKKNKIVKKNISIGLINRVLFLLTISCCAYYLYGMSSLSVKGFELREKSDRLTELNDDNERLKLSIMGMESYDKLNGKMDRLKMVKAEKMTFLTYNPGQVALK